MDYRKELYHDFSLYFPGVADITLDYYTIGLYELVVRTEEGEIFSYNDIDRTLRILPSDPDSLDEDEFRTEFSIRLKRMMYIKGITQSELSNYTDIPQYLISDYIRGKRTPSFYNVDKIAKALDCSVDELRYY